jgi:putative hemolysin
MTRKTLLISIVLICLMVLTACSPASTRPTPQVKMPNPAAVQCEQNGVQLELR